MVWPQYPSPLHTNVCLDSEPTEVWDSVSLPLSLSTIFMGAKFRTDVRYWKRGVFKKMLISMLWFHSVQAPTLSRQAHSPGPFMCVHICVLLEVPGTCVKTSWHTRPTEWGRNNKQLSFWTLKNKCYFFEIQGIVTSQNEKLRDLALFWAIGTVVRMQRYQCHGAHM